MTEMNYPAWICLAIGIYSVAAGIGEFRKPGFWASMMDNIISNDALRFIVGIICIAIGTAIYLVEPWGRQDYLLYIVKIIGFWMVIEGALFIALGDLFLDFVTKVLNATPRLWAILSIIIGIAMIIAAEVNM